MWVHHQRAGDRDPLLLAAGELMRVLMSLLLEPDHGEELSRARLGVPSAHLPDPARREREVVHRGEVGEEVELLEDDPDALPNLGHRGALAA